MSMKIPHIKPLVKNLNRENLSDFSDQFKNPKVSISFFGRKYVTVDGFAGNVSLHDLTRKVRAVVKNPLTGDSIQTFPAKAHSISIQKKLVKLYDESSNIKLNLITKILTAVRDFFSDVYVMYGPLWHVRNDVDECQIVLNCDVCEWNRLHSPSA